MVQLIQDGNTYNIPLKTFYVESEEELSQIRLEEPAGTMVFINTADGVNLVMKDSQGNWNSFGA